MVCSEHGSSQKTAEAGIYFRAMAHNNAWANHRLHAACAKLGEEELRRTRTSFFPSLALTLNHIRLVDLFYIDALEGGSQGYTVFADHDRPPAFEVIRREQAALDRRLIAFCGELDEAALAAPASIHRQGRVQTERADRLLLHLFQHQIHHRGQAHAMLAGTDVPPPQLDEFFPAEEAPLRAADLAELGFDEAAIWRGF
jgi:uncharacterized damage-inducible protein DinB